MISPQRHNPHPHAKRPQHTVDGFQGRITGVLLQLPQRPPGYLAHTGEVRLGEASYPDSQLTYRFAQTDAVRIELAVDVGKDFFPAQLFGRHASPQLREVDGRLLSGIRAFQVPAAGPEKPGSASSTRASRCL